MQPEELKSWRIKYGLNQQRLADLLGVTTACISRWESGDRNIPAFLHITLKCLKVKKGGALKKRAKGMKKKKEVKR